MIDPAYVAILRVALTYFSDEGKKFLASQGGQPKSGSKAENEATSYSHPESIVNAWPFAQNLIEFVGDHVAALSLLLVEPIVINAVWTCVRSPLESSALAAWLLDPTIDAKKRAGRVFAMRYDNVEQQLKYLNATRAPTTETEPVKKRLDKIEQEALSQGFQKVENRNTERTGAGVRLKGATEIIGLVLDEEANYRILSGVVHGNDFALRGLGYKPAAALMTNIAGVTLTAFEKIVNVDAVAVFGTAMMKAFAIPLWNQCKYFGWHEDGLEEIFEAVADKMDLTNPMRFWRPEEHRKP